MYQVLLDKFTRKVLEIAVTTFAVSAATMLAERVADRLVYGAAPSDMPPSEPLEVNKGTVVNIVIHGGSPHIYLDQGDLEEEDDEEEEE